LGEIPASRWETACIRRRSRPYRERQPETADYAPRLREGEGRMRVMFVTWLTVIAAGLVFYAVIGLTHH
jgi:hypothetical protein